MVSLIIAGIIFGCTFGGALLGMKLRSRLPQGHLGDDTKETVKLSTGIVGTMSAVLLGLLVASAKSSFDVQRNGVAQLAANIILLDRNLKHYGEETREIRQMLRAAVTDIIQRTWPDQNALGTLQTVSAESEGQYELMFEKILTLVPRTEAQRALHDHALKVVSDTGQLRWTLYSQRENSIPIPLLVVMVFWLSISFASFGLYSPRNATAVVALIACAMAVSSALFLILELDRPFRGMIQISSTPLYKALDQLGR